MGVGRPGAGITSPVKIVANIFISFIGAGMLGLPFAFKEAGIMEGALIMAVVGYLSVAAMLMLIDCKYAILSSGGRAGGRSIIMEKKVPLLPPDSSDDEDEDERHPPTPSTDLTYGDVGLYAMGPGGKRLVDIAIVVSQIGFCCGYLIYLCKNLNLYIPRISQKVWLILLLPPLYLLTLLRHLNKLAVFSLFAQISNVLALAVVFWFDFSHSEEVPFQPNEFSIKGFPFFFAVSIYCYEGAGMIFSLEESVAEKKRDKFRSIFVCTMTGLTTLYICFGVSGYASFGPHTMDIITLNLPHSSGSVDFAALVKICLGISLFFTYPMMMFPVTHLLDKTFGLQNAPHKGNMLRVVLVSLTGLVVSAVPNFGILISLIGATCCTLLAFILPAAFHLSIFRQRLTKRQWYFDMFLVVLGVIGSVVGLWDAFNRMSEGHDPLLEVNEFSQSTGRNNSLHNHVKHLHGGI
ncbi:amino acid transporter AVT3B-like isoform X2 [Penaeus chinensis]|uniref:amino acid transporter AVT3B-like isoform X2 n=1 Tax=Penaeus chinensis TaxID=139456 RepID=UPI001FB6D3DC|nr:amino acid transporter AVT3B-like isoform X2 [Penaeus chinensis]